MDSTHWKGYGEIDPELEALLPHLPPFKSFADFESVAECRAGIRAQAAALPAADLTNISKVDIKIPVRDGSMIRGVLYRPEDAEREAGPLFVYYHGGGWVLGWPEMYENRFELLVRELGFTVVSVDYRKAPEWLFPTAAHDAIDSAKWISENASQLGADPSKGFIVSGTSAGGNLASVVSHAAADEKWERPITGVFLSIPSLLHPDSVREEHKPHWNSWEENKDAIVLDQKAMVWFMETYQADPKSKFINPLNWPSGHKTQPPTFLQLAGMDPLRDDGLIYEYLLREQGVPTRLNVYKGIPHGMQDTPLPISSLQTVPADIKSGILWLLNREK